MKIGDRIKEKRLEKGWSRSDLADALDVTLTAVWNWEQKGIMPRPRLLPRIAEALSVNEHYLLAGADRQKSKQGVAGIIENARQEVAKELGVAPARVQLELKITVG